MAVNTANLVMGPANLYVAPFGTAFPADSTATVAAGPPVPASGSGSYVDVGGTSDGVTVEIDQTYTDMNVDQIVDPVGARLTKRDITIVTKMAENSIANLTTALNNLVTTSVQTGYTSVDLQTTTSATQPTYATLVVDGWSPMLNSGQGARGRFVIGKVLAKAKLGVKYDLKNMSLYEVTFQAYYINGTTSPIHYVSQTA